MEIHEQINESGGTLAERVVRLLRARAFLSGYLSATQGCPQWSEANYFMSETQHYPESIRTALERGNEATASKLVSIGLVLVENARVILAAAWRDKQANSKG